MSGGRTQAEARGTVAQGAANWRERGSKMNAADFVIPPVQFAATCTPSSPIERLSSLPIYQWRCAKRANRYTLTMTTFYSVVTTKKMKKINVLRFLRKKMYCHKCLNIIHLELE